MPINDQKPKRDIAIFVGSITIMVLLLWILKTTPPQPKITMAKNNNQAVLRF